VTTGSAGVRRAEGVTLVTFPALRPPLVGGLLFYSAGPVVALALAAGRRSAIVCQSPYEAVLTIALAKVVPAPVRPPVQVELHGDWRTAPRMYGSRARKVVGPLADRACEWAVRRADRVRAVSVLLEQRAREVGYAGPIDRHITFSDFQVFLATPPAPPPAEPRVVFAGVFERYKAVDVLLDAWAEVVRGVPDAELVCVGDGSLGPRLRRQAADHGLNGSVRFVAPMPRESLTGLIDRSRCLVLPSRSEGLPRIVMEAMARGRAVVATTVGGMDELVEHDRTGLLVQPEDVHGLAQALTEVLTHPDRARAMGAEGRRRAEDRDPLREYEAGIARLADWIANWQPRANWQLRGGKSRPTAASSRSPS
jgi:glycosyltransferase involved in cell wall biosynthesis